MASLKRGIRIGAVALVGTLILSACGQSFPNQGVGQVSVARGQAVLMVTPQVIAGGYKAQALVENYKKSDINHLVIKVFELQGGVEVPVVDGEGDHVQVDLLNSELDVPVKFSNLFRNTTYRIRCYAYKAPGEAPADLISTLDAFSYTDVSITNDNAPTVAQLRVRLVDVVFNGEFTSGVDVTEGGFVPGGPTSSSKVFQPSSVTTLAGSTRGFVDGSGSAAKFSTPEGIAQGPSGDLFVVDAGNHAVRMVTLHGVVSTVLGGALGFIDGHGQAARFASPQGIAISADGTIYLADTFNHCIRRALPDGSVSTFAGSGAFGFINGVTDSASFDQPSALALDIEGNLYVADTNNHAIRKITPDGQVTTLAGNGEPGYADGSNSSARFNSPKGIAIDSLGNIFVADTGNHRVRKITASGNVSTLAGDGFFSWKDGDGQGAQFDEPTGIAIDSVGNLYVTDLNNYCIRKITPLGVVSTLAGRGVEGFVDAIGTDAEFDQPSGITIGDGFLYITDRNNHRIRRIRL